VLAVEPKAFRVLLLLLRNPQKLISKEELLNAVWGDTAVTEGSLTCCIWLLRRQLGDDINEPRFIETVATVGYRFVCKVEVSEDGSGDPQATGEANRLNEGDFVETPANGEMAANPLTQIDKPADDRERSRFRSWLLAGAVILIVGLATAIWYLRHPLPRLTNPVQLTRDGRRKNVVGTDGNRLYLNVLEPTAVGQVPVSGGQITEIPIDLPSQGGQWGISSVSPDGSSLLVFDHLDSYWERSKSIDCRHSRASGSLPDAILPRYIFTRRQVRALYNSARRYLFNSGGGG
jgi:DNA-binding winged helix-turn-helix (wHTH) protein